MVMKKTRDVTRVAGKRPLIGSAPLRHASEKQSGKERAPGSLPTSMDLISAD